MEHSTRGKKNEDKVSLIARRDETLNISSRVLKNHRSRDGPLMKEHLGRCAEQLRYAVRYLANSSCGPQAKLRGMYRDTQFGSVCQDDFLEGSLKNDYLTIKGSLINGDEPNAAVNIAAMSDEQAWKVISQVCSLNEAVAYVLGRQSH